MGLLLYSPLFCYNRIRQYTNAGDFYLYPVAGLHGPYTRRSAGDNEITRQQRDDLGDEFQKLGQGSDELSRFSFLLGLTIEPGYDGQVSGIETGNNSGTNGRKSIGGFASCPLSLGLLQVPGSDIVADGISQYIVQSFISIDTAHGFSNNHGELAFIVHPFRYGGIDDFSFGVIDTGRRL